MKVIVNAVRLPVVFGFAGVGGRLVLKYRKQTAKLSAYITRGKIDECKQTVVYR